ncbi:hypothetical protein BHU72_12210 [Desulfuribacillus stibiiarsenatis]|uniref:Histidine kinase/HSP90-like ATPase domain-containing protein n=1 Tax=Desulfuribacillus stibiiarsenatis TaxID=1390249 RepID=A0A1E5L237_9FIRM|nr:ATP-binding protein [Desulfuribacillus stibiiarsenatis]OEH84164.1 hypothetical protein BHU72_12210 [Desulfuribacillus stibiiarsenatis]
MLGLEKKIKKNQYVMEFNSEFKLMDFYIVKILGILQREFDEYLRFVICEMISNAIEHGNKMNFDKKIKVMVEDNKLFYRIVVADQGEGFDWATLVNEDINLEGHSDRGRGIIMTKMMCDNISYNSIGNEVTLIVMKNRMC